MKQESRTFQYTPTTVFNGHTTSHNFGDPRSGTPTDEGSTPTAIPLHMPFSFIKVSSKFG